MIQSSSDSVKQSTANRAKQKKSAKESGEAYQYGRHVRSSSSHVLPSQILSWGNTKENFKKEISARYPAVKNERKLRPVKAIGNDRFHDGIWENQFVSLVSQNDYIALTGESPKEKTTSIVDIGAEPHLIKTSKHLKKGTIIPSKNALDCRLEEYSLTYHKEALKEAKAVIVSMELQSSMEIRKKLEVSRMDEKGEAIVTNVTKDMMLEALSDCPFIVGRYYKMDFPFIWSSAPGGKSAFSLDGQTKLCQIFITVEPTGPDANCNILKVGGSTHIELALKGKGIRKKGTTVEDYKNLLKYITIKQSNYTPVNNYAYLSCYLYHILQILGKQPEDMSLTGSVSVQGESSSECLNEELLVKKRKTSIESSPYMVCKINNYHFFCMPITDLHDVFLIKMNALHKQEMKSATGEITPCPNCVLKTATSCQIYLDWYLYPQSIELNSAGIVKNVRQALCQIPLKTGRKFLVSLHDEGEVVKAPVVQGKIITFDGDDALEKDGQTVCVIADESTQISLTGTSDVLVNGGTVYGEKQRKDAIIKDLINGLAGMESVAEQIYNKIIQLLTNYDFKSNDRLTQRGAILTGPPGNGKTQLAKNLIAVLKVYFNAEVVPITHNFLDGSAKQTQEAIEYKVTAIARQNLSHKRFVICFLDEFDTLVMGSEPDQSISDSKTAFKTELQTCISDGPKNLFFIATSNKHISWFDLALTRSGRIGIHINIECPDREQRKAIFKQYFTDKGFQCSEESISKLALSTGKSSSADLIAKADVIVMKEILQGENKKNLITEQDIQLALVEPSKIHANYKQAVSLISDKAEESELLESELESSQSVVKAINRVSSGMGKHTAIMVKVDQDRSETICYHLLKEVYKLYENKAKVLKMFHNFQMVPCGSNMINETYVALSCINAAERTVIIVDGVDKLLKEKSLPLKLEELGQKWKTITESNSHCAALVLIYSDASLTVEDVKKKMEISLVNTDLTVNSTVTKESIGKIIDERNACKAMKYRLLEIFDNNDLKIDYCKYLLELYEETDEHGYTTWDVEAIKKDIATNKELHYSLYY